MITNEIIQETSRNPRDLTPANTADSVAHGPSQHLFIAGWRTETPGNLTTTSSKAASSFDFACKLFSIYKIVNHDQVFP